MDFENSFKALELDKILAMLADEASCQDTKKLALTLKPANDIQSVQNLLNETNDAHMMCARFGSPSFGGLENIETSLKRASMGGLLSMHELLVISKNLRIFRLIKDWEKKCSNTINSINKRLESVFPKKHLETKITDCIISDEEMSDSASPELSDIRRKIRSISSKIRDQLDKVIKSPSQQKFLQDPIVTIRDSRFVVPVKAEHKNEIHGIVHDTSSSGATLFIEPMNVVKANNDIRVLKSKEKTEIERILFSLSKEVSDHVDSIRLSYDTCVKLNLIFAKASLAFKMKACTPTLNDTGKISLKKARHPLIKTESIVPIDCRLGEDFDTLIITGPNTGGKTVSLKTVGLLTLMTMCGLMIPAQESSQISVFENILADIGDEQSIEQSLSTFSSHMINIINIMVNSNNKSLILLDELGAGTDPIEGAALATSILEHLKKSGAKTVATTHYAELKTYALSTNRVENACCEFDVSTLKPTYKLLIGMPGKSNAFAIAERLGMDVKVIKRAHDFVKEGNIRFEKTIESLEKKRLNIEKEQNKISLEKKQTEIFKDELLLERKKLEQERKKIIQDAINKAEKIVSQTQAQAQETLSLISRIKSKTPSLEDKFSLKRKIKQLQQTSNPVTSTQDNSYSLPRKLKLGDDVLIISMDKKGSVLEDPSDDSKDVLIQAGIIKMRVPINDLKLLDTTKHVGTKITSYGNVKIPSKTTANVKSELDLRGQTSLESLFELDKFIDNAVLSGLSVITVIHGKGTGTLRKEIHKHLKSHPSVKSFRIGKYGEGESGVTIVELS